MNIPSSAEQADECGRRVKSLRHDKDWSQRELSEAIRCSREVIIHIEAGRRPPTIRNLCLLAVVLGVSTDYLLCLTDRQERLDNAA